VAAGKVRYVGLSDVPAWVAAQAQTIAHFRGWAPITRCSSSTRCSSARPKATCCRWPKPLASASYRGVHCAAAGCRASTPRNNGAPAQSRSATGRHAELTERDWDVIDAVARAAAELGVSSAEVALAWVRSRPAVTSTLIGARTIEQLRSNLASLEITLTPEQLAALNEPSMPSLGFPAAIIAEITPAFGFGGATVDGVELPVWPQLLASSARY
jgi:aryl-alcohol dehydrogenase-like predicted oxidoreductase